MSAMTDTGYFYWGLLFKDILWMSNTNSGIPAALSTVYDGAGNASVLKLSQTQVGLGNIIASANTVTTGSGDLTLTSFSSNVNLGSSGSAGTVNLGTMAGAVVTLGNASGTTQINGTVTFGGSISYTNLTLSGYLKAQSIVDTNANNALTISTTASAVNYLNVLNNATGSGAYLRALGSDSNIPLNLQPKGTGSVNLFDGNSNLLLSTATTTSAVNNLKITNAATGNAPILSAIGSDTNIGIQYTSKGTGQHTFNNAVNFATIVTVASSGTTNIGVAASNCIVISGTTTITAFDSVASGVIKFVEFSGALILTYNASSLILPSKANITTAAGDTAIFQSLGSGNWRCLSYTLVNGKTLVGSTTNAPLTQVSVPAAFTSTGTYTPTTGMVYCIAKMVGGGASGGGCGSAGSAFWSGASGGGAGGYAEVLLTAAQVGASQTITIGAGGSAPSAGNNNGNAGGTTSIGSLVSCAGGAAGTSVGSNSSYVVGGAGGAVTVTTGTAIISKTGNSGGSGHSGAQQIVLSGFGANSELGAGGYGVGSNSNNAGIAGTGYGSGGSGGAQISGNVAGGAGAGGYVSITEFLSV